MRPGFVTSARKYRLAPAGTPSTASRISILWPIRVTFERPISSIGLKIE
jgi:hypothetical protein